MKCGTLENNLFLYVDGSLSDRKTRAVRNHISGCGACRDRLSLLEQYREEMENIDITPAPPDFAAKVEERLCDIDGEAAGEEDTEREVAAADEAGPVSRRLASFTRFGKSRRSAGPFRSTWERLPLFLTGGAATVAAVVLVAAVILFTPAGDFRYPTVTISMVSIPSIGEPVEHRGTREKGDFGDADDLALFANISSYGQIGGIVESAGGRVLRNKITRETGMIEWILVSMPALKIPAFFEQLRALGIVGDGYPAESKRSNGTVRMKFRIVPNVIES